MRQNQRNSTLELLRILAMCMILGLHYIAPTVGGALDTANSTNRAILHVLESFCIPSVNVFVLISGYFLISRRTTGLRKAVELYLIMVILDIALLFFGVLTGECAITFHNVVLALVPFAYGQHWFLETYILLLLFLPFLNLLIDRLGQKAHALLIGVQLLIFSLWPSFLPSSPLTDNGYGLTNFITMYLIAAYLRKHVVFRGKKKTALLAALVWLGSVAAIAVSSFIPYLRSAAWRYCYLFAISAATALFILFLNLPEFHSGLVNLISGTTFDVYITHAFVLLQPLVYQKLMQIPRFRDLPLMPLHFLICIILQFVVFSLLGLLRTLIWKPTVGRLLARSRLLAAEQAWEEQAFQENRPAGAETETSGAECQKTGVQNQ